jgi:hypothetical protein
VWRLVDGEHSLDEIVSLLASSYGVDAAEIRPHVVHTLDTFAELGLLCEEASA